jgi:hypothetical protein
MTVSTEELTRIIQATVRETVKVMKREGMMRSSEDIALAETSARLYAHYREKPDPEIEAALRTIRKDKYFDIIPRFYSRQCTIEELAGMYDRDTATIWRAKKRLCRKICESLKG